MRRTLLATAILGATAVCMVVLTPQGAASGSSESSGPSSSSLPQIYTATPGYSNSRDAVNKDVLLDRIVFADGVTVREDQFIYPASVTNMQYNGPIDRFRRQNGAIATVGPQGVAYIDDLDGDGSSVSPRVLVGNRLPLPLTDRGHQPVRQRPIGDLAARMRANDHGQQARRLELHVGRHDCPRRVNRRIGKTLRVGKRRLRMVLHGGVISAENADQAQPSVRPASFARHSRIARSVRGSG